MRLLRRTYRRFKLKMKSVKKANRTPRETLPKAEKLERTPEEKRFGIDAGLT